VGVSRPAPPQRGQKKYFAISEKVRIFANVKPNDFCIMTALEQRIRKTRMAPYVGLLHSLTREEKEAVVAFLVDIMEESEQLDHAEIIREKYKNLKISPEIQRLRGCLKLTEEELNDERTQYILES